MRGKYNSHTKGARRACHEKLDATRMDPGQDPENFFFTLDEYCQQLEDMGESVHDERYEDIILQALPVEYERVRQTSHEKRDFGLDDIRHMVHSIYVNNLSRPSKSSLIAGRGVAMKAIGDNNSNNLQWCNYCKKSTDHVIQDCARLKAKRHRDQSNQHAPPSPYLHRASPRKGR